jgi:hypothetical protein
MTPHLQCIKSVYERRYPRQRDRCIHSCLNGQRGSIGSPRKLTVWWQPDNELSEDQSDQWSGQGESEEPWREQENPTMKRQSTEQAERDTDIQIDR